MSDMTARERLMARVLFHLEASRAARDHRTVASLREKIKCEEAALAVLAVVSVGLLVAGLWLMAVSWP